MNSTLDMLHKIADKLGIPQQGQSEAQLALDIHLILKDLESQQDGRAVNIKRESPQLELDSSVKLFQDCKSEMLHHHYPAHETECDNDRLQIINRMIALVGQIGKQTVQAKQCKAVNSVLSLLWEVAHSTSITPHVVELALKEHLNTLSALSMNVHTIMRQYILLCVDDIKKSNKVMLPFVKHLHEICKSYGSKSSAWYQEGASKAIILELNKNHEIVKLISKSLNKAHKQAVQSATQMGLVLKPDTLVDSTYTHQESVQIHLELMQFLLKDGHLYLSWARCKELLETLITNENGIQMDQDCLFTWFSVCHSDLEAETQKLLYKKLLSLPPANVSQNSFICLQER